MTMLNLCWRSWRVLLYLLVLAPACATEVIEIRIGLRAHSGTEVAFQQWQPTADYLTQRLPGYHFSIVPYTQLDQLMQAAGQNQFELVFTNPSSYVEMNQRYDTQALVTLINKRNDTPQTRFGSVIFTHAELHDIHTLKDLRNKRLMAVSEPAFGGWRVAWQELRQHGVDPYEDLGQLSWGEGNQFNVVYAVRDKKVDAGVVRTDMLERMAAEKLIDLRTFRVLNPRESPDFPFFHSTPLYPEWPLAAMADMTHELRQKIIFAMLEMPDTAPAAMAGKYYGWVSALDYEPVRQLMQALGVCPYETTEKVSVLNSLLNSLWIVVVLLLILVTVTLLRAKRRHRS